MPSSATATATRQSTHRSTQGWTKATLVGNGETREREKESLSLVSSVENRDSRKKVERESRVSEEKRRDWFMNRLDSLIVTKWSDRTRGASTCK